MCPLQRCPSELCSQYRQCLLVLTLSASSTRSAWLGPIFIGDTPPLTLAVKIGHSLVALALSQCVHSYLNAHLFLLSLFSPVSVSLCLLVLSSFFLPRWIRFTHHWMVNSNHYIVPLSFLQLPSIHASITP